MPDNQQQPVQSLTLNESQIKQLEAIIQDLPTKHGVPLLSFLNAVAQANFNETQAKDTKGDAVPAQKEVSKLKAK